MHLKYGMAKPEMNGTHALRLCRRASALIGALAVFGTTAFAGAPNADQATRMYNRIAGVPPTAAQLAQMMAAADPVTAALIATQDPSFYNNSIRNMATPWTNRDQTVFAPLNDYTATVVGMVRDDVPFNTLLSANILYIADSSAGVPAYSPSNNDMYEALDADGIDLSKHLVSTTQSTMTGIPAAATAGVMTTRAAANEFFMEPMHVPVHHYQSPVQRPADRHGHHAPTRSNPPGCVAQPGRRQHIVSYQLHWLPQWHGSHGSSLRLLPVQLYRSH